MKIEIHLDAYETYSNIGMAKAMVESTLSANDLKEIAEHLLIYCDAHPTEKDGEEE